MFDLDSDDSLESLFLQGMLSDTQMSSPESVTTFTITAGSEHAKARDSEPPARVIGKICGGEDGFRTPNF